MKFLLAIIMTLMLCVITWGIYFLTTLISGDTLDSTRFAVLLSATAIYIECREYIDKSYEE